MTRPQLVTAKGLTSVGARTFLFAMCIPLAHRWRSHVRARLRRLWPRTPSPAALCTRQGSAHREFTDAIGILFIVPTVSLSSCLLLNNYCHIFFISFAISNIWSYSSPSALWHLYLDIQSRILLRNVDPRELHARCDMEVFRTLNEIFQIPNPIISLSNECQLILFSMCSTVQQM